VLTLRINELEVPLDASTDTRRAYCTREQSGGRVERPVIECNGHAAGPGPAPCQHHRDADTRQSTLHLPIDTSGQGQAHTNWDERAFRQDRLHPGVTDGRQLERGLP